MKINSIFTDNMVLQANAPVRIFGEGAGEIYAQIDNLSGSVSCNGEKFVLELSSHDYGGPYDMKITLNGEERIIKNIYFGDVFLVAGQSNLQLKLFETVTPKEEYKSNPLLRLFTLERPEEGEFFFPKDGWVVAEEESVDKWTAIGYLCGNIHSQKTGHAVGLVACYQGASMIQSWLPKGILNGTECDIATEEKSGHMRPPEYMLWNGDGFLYNKMFLKYAPFATKAVIWYQGESNSEPPENKTEIYVGMLRRLIEKWREDLKDDKLPFIVVQLPNLNGVSCPEGWDAVKRAQAQITDVCENTFCVVSEDICEDNHIHPPTKLPLAQRIAELL